MLNFNGYILGFMEEMKELKSRNDKKIQEIIEEYKQTANLPRKQKKKRRKELNIEYNIFKYAADNIYNYGF